MEEYLGQALIARTVELARRQGTALVFVLIEREQGDLQAAQIRQMRTWISAWLAPSVRLVETIDTFEAATRTAPGGLGAFWNPPPLCHFNRAGQRLIAEAVRAPVGELLAPHQVSIGSGDFTAFIRIDRFSMLASQRRGFNAGPPKVAAAWRRAPYQRPGPL